MSKPERAAHARAAELAAMTRETIESAARILMHARNVHRPALRASIRAALRRDLAALRALRRANPKA